MLEMNKKGFTLIELLAVIVVLAIVLVLAVSTVLPLGNEAREKALRLEATNAVESAETAYNTYKLGEFKFTENATDKCYNSSTKTMCFTVASLIDLGYYDLEDDDKENFKGKVVLDLTDSKNPSYTLYFKKNDEFRFVGLKRKNFTKKGELDNDAWQESYENCSCN